MVSLIDIYKIKESTLTELKSNRDPSRGDKGKGRESEFYFIDEPEDPETGSIKSKVVYKRSIANMIKDLEAEIQDFEKLIKEEKYENDIVLYNITEDLKDIFNTFRTHVRKKYPDEYKKVEEASATGTGASFTPGVSMAYATPKAFAKKGKWKNKKTIYREQEEEELSKDVKALEKLIHQRINTKDEWIDMFQLLMTHSEEINGLNDSTIRSLLQQSMKEL
jgi:hypothetical protein